MFQAFVQEALAAAEVIVDARFGSWDAAQQQVVPPEGPAQAPSSTVPVPGGSVPLTLPEG